VNLPLSLSIKILCSLYIRVTIYMLLILRQTHTLGLEFIHPIHLVSHTDMRNFCYCNCCFTRSSHPMDPYHVDSIIIGSNLVIIESHGRYPWNGGSGKTTFALEMIHFLSPSIRFAISTCPFYLPFIYVCKNCFGIVQICMFCFCLLQLISFFFFLMLSN
jgi:hypothetical protein